MAVALREQVELLSKRWSDVKKAKPRTPEDPSANRIVGSFYCLTKGQWSKGLPLLASCDDSDLRSAARIDLDAKEEPGGAVRVGDVWWNLGRRSLS